MTNLLSVPSDFSTWQAAENAIPAVPTEPQIIEIDADALPSSEEAFSINGSTFTSDNNLTIRTLATASTLAQVFREAGITIVCQDDFLIFERIKILTFHSQAFSLFSNDCTMLKTLVEATRSGSFVINMAGARNVLKDSMINGITANRCLGLSSLSNDTLVENCTIINNVGTVVAASCVTIINGLSNNTFKNNLFCMNSVANVCVVMSGSSHVGLVMDGNQYMFNSNVGSGVIEFDGTRYFTLASATADLGLEANSPVEREALHISIGHRLVTEGAGVGGTGDSTDIFGEEKGGQDIGPMNFAVNQFFNEGIVEVVSNSIQTNVDNDVQVTVEVDSEDTRSFETTLS